MNFLNIRSNGCKALYISIILILLLSFMWPVDSPASALQESSWSTPQVIPGYDPEAWPPILVVDQDRTVYAFTTQWIKLSDKDPIMAIVYNQWSLEDGWTPPVDILISPVKQARVTDVYLDKNGIIHLVFFGGDNTGADIYYSRVPALNADDASAWSIPLVIGENAGDPENAIFTEDSAGTLYVVYNGRQQGSGLYVVNSSDGGENWSNSTPIFFARSDEANIDQLNIIRSSSGWFHAVWAVYNKLGQGRGIYYSRSQDGLSWSEPIMLAETEDGLGTQTPMITEYKDSIIFLYNVSIRILERISSDDGNTWSDPSFIFPRHVGVNGRVSFVVDGQNNLHLFFGQRISGKPDMHGMWHSTYVNNRWLEPEAIVKGPRGIDDTGENSFDPFEARAIVSQGNVLLVTWRTDPGLKGNGIWFSYKVLNIRESPVIKLPGVPSEQKATHTPTLPSQINSTNAVTPQAPDTIDHSLFEERSNPRVWNLQTYLALGIVLLMILIIILARTKSKHTRL